MAAGVESGGAKCFSPRPITIVKKGTREAKHFRSGTEAAEFMGCHATSVSYAKNKPSRSCRGFTIFDSSKAPDWCKESAPEISGERTPIGEEGVSEDAEGKHHYVFAFACAFVCLVYSASAIDDLALRKLIMGSIVGTSDCLASAPTTCAWPTLPDAPGATPSPVGLCMGIGAVFIGQLLVIAYFFGYTGSGLAAKNRIQTADYKPYSFLEGTLTHLAQPEGFFLLGSYLTLTWMYRFMPDSYYSFEGGVNWYHVLAQALSVDFLQTVMHMLEHKGFYITPQIYIKSHKPHHRFYNPRMFDAFDGSLADTFAMILVPLYITANIVHCNVWSYMAFGTIYSSSLTLIHSEYYHPWDDVFRMLGVGTAGDHHVHHRLQKYNFGHLFMYWDRLMGTYKSPKDCKNFN